MRALMWGAVIATAVILATASASPATTVAPTSPSLAPTIFSMSIHIGWEVDATTGGKVCVVGYGHECRSRTQSDRAGGFHYPASVAADPRTGSLYVADLANYRVQKFSPDGSFVLMFGGEVNGTADGQPRASWTRRDLCTASSGYRCRAGTPGGAPGQLFYPQSVAVDPLRGDVYVLENGPGDTRLDKYTSGGRFVWTVGKGVNVSTGGNLCGLHEIARSGMGCRGGAENASNSAEPGAFHPASVPGDLISMGGPEDLIHVGDEHRVQEFDTRGHLRREIVLASASAARSSAVSSLAVDRGGDVYLVYRTLDLGDGAGREHVDVIRRFNPSGEQVAQFPVLARLGDAELHIDGIAVDGDGHLAVIGVEVGPSFYKRFGFVYDGPSGRLVGEFPPPQDNDGLAFDGKGDLYVAATDDQEIVGYESVPAGGLLTNVVGRYPATSAASVTPRNGASAR